MRSSNIRSIAKRCWENGRSILMPQKVLDIFCNDLFFTKIRLDQKWSITAISGLDLPNLNFPALTEFKTIYTTFFYSSDSFQCTQRLKPIATLSFFPSQMFERAPFFSSTSSVLYFKDPLCYAHESQTTLILSVF